MTRNMEAGRVRPTGDRTASAALRVDRTGRLAILPCHPGRGVGGGTLPGVWLAVVAATRGRERHQQSSEHTMLLSFVSW
jgi:hypothetical protein